ncbi:hypothetical protein CEXT_797921 [Caerostris extrusa]|uniref:Uncharacterized protein n=1 Tax=Caerostris extrusa TaxID=172846 RepID=A0AAV4W631_CAEEX|nr:hypothetical protein CEXT_797921 [Caerostris extrusa]
MRYSYMQALNSALDYLFVKISSLVNLLPVIPYTRAPLASPIRFCHISISPQKQAFHLKKEDPPANAATYVSKLPLVNLLRNPLHPRTKLASPIRFRHISPSTKASPPLKEGRSQVCP